MEANTKYSQRRLAKGFKSVRMAYEAGGASIQTMATHSSQGRSVRDTGNSVITPMGLEIPK